VGVEHQQRPVHGGAVAQRADEHDEALVGERVDERRVLVPSVLLAHRARVVPAGAALSDHREVHPITTVLALTVPRCPLSMLARWGYSGGDTEEGALGMREFAVTVEELSTGVVRVGLRGELSLERAYEFDEELRIVEARHPSCVMIDLRELRFLDSSGLSRLLAARKRARRNGHRLLLIRGPRTVQRLLALTGVAETFEIVSEVPVALR